MARKYSSPQARLQEEQRFIDAAGKLYGLEEMIGEGGNHIVYKAWHGASGDNRDYVVKRLKMDDVSLDDVDVVKNFERQTEVLAGLKHRTIVDGVEGFLAEIESGEGVSDVRFYHVEEYVEGKTLKECIDQIGRYRIDDAMRILHPLLGCLIYLEREGVIHRDIKPSNVIVTSLIAEPAEIKLIDFGVARTRAGTFTGTMGIGTDNYWAQEQVGGQPVPKSDVYSLGITFVEMLLGSPSEYMKSETFGGLDYDKVKDGLKREDIYSRKLMKLIKKMTAKEAKDRWDAVKSLDYARRISVKEVEETPIRRYVPKPVAKVKPVKRKSGHILDKPPEPWTIPPRIDHSEISDVLESIREDYPRSAVGRMRAWFKGKPSRKARSETYEELETMLETMKGYIVDNPVTSPIAWGGTALTIVASTGIGTGVAVVAGLCGAIGSWIRMFYVGAKQGRKEEKEKEALKRQEEEDRLNKVWKEHGIRMTDYIVAKHREGGEAKKEDKPKAEERSRQAERERVRRSMELGNGVYLGSNWKEADID